MLLFVYTTTRKRFVIFTCRYFKLSWNTTALSQSNCRNFSCSGINDVIYFLLHCIIYHYKLAQRNLVTILAKSFDPLELATFGARYLLKEAAWPHGQRIRLATRPWENKISRSIFMLLPHGWLSISRPCFQWLSHSERTSTSLIAVILAGINTHLKSLFFYSYSSMILKSWRYEVVLNVWIRYAFSATNKSTSLKMSSCTGPRSSNKPPDANRNHVPPFERSVQT